MENASAEPKSTRSRKMPQARVEPTVESKPRKKKKRISTELEASSASNNKKPKKKKSPVVSHENDSGEVAAARHEASRIADEYAQVMLEEESSAPPADIPSIELQPLKRDTIKPVFERRITNNNVETIIVDSENEVVTADKTKNYCLLGSLEHKKVINARLRALNESCRGLKQEKDIVSQRLKEAEEERKRLKKQEYELEKLRNWHDHKAATNDAHHHSHENHESETHESVRLFGKLKNELGYIKNDDEQERVLFKMPRVRQYFEDKRLFREFDSRKAETSELFFDLAMAAVIGEIGKLLECELTGWNVYIYIITFMPIWKTWMDTHNFLNRHDNSDVTMKVFVYFEMLMLVILGCSADGAATGPLVTQFVAALVLARGLIVLFNLAYGFVIPEFRFSLYMSALTVLSSCVMWLVALGTPTESLHILFVVANIMDYLLHFAIVQITMAMMDRQIARRNKASPEEKEKIPPVYRIAVNIEHYTERLGLLTILTIGEQIYAYLFALVAPGFSMALLASSLGLIISFGYQFTYFEVHASRSFQHAFRANRFAGFGFSNLHLPLHMAFIAAGNSLRVFVNYYNPESESACSEQIIPTSQRWLLCGSFSLAMFAMVFIALTHVDKDPAGLTKLTKVHRLSARVVVAVIVCLLPLAGDDLIPVGLIAIIACVVILLVVFELFAALKRKPKPLTHSLHTMLGSVVGIASPHVAEASMGNDSKKKIEHHSVHIAHSHHDHHSHHHHHGHKKEVGDHSPTKSMFTHRKKKQTKESPAAHHSSIDTHTNIEVPERRPSTFDELEYRNEISRDNASYHSESSIPYEPSELSVATTASSTSSGTLASSLNITRSSLSLDVTLHEHSETCSAEF